MYLNLCVPGDSNSGIIFWVRSGRRRKDLEQENHAVRCISSGSWICAAGRPASDAAGDRGLPGMKILTRLSLPRLCDWLALVLSLAGFLAAAWVTWHIYDAVPHIEDEIAYAWQANLLADGRLSMPSPEYPKSFLVPFVVDHEGLRFSKYPPGWPAVLCAGCRIGAARLDQPAAGRGWASG